MSEFEERECGIMLTIESRLELYAKEKEEECNAILWYVWQQNKRWLSNILDWILPSFPNYSMHDKSHAFSVLHNIEMLLGERQIMKLSASDCFMILHVVFLHDIGMCITASDREKLMSTLKFINFLKEGAEKGDDQIQKYSQSLLRYCERNDAKEKTENILKDKLEVYYAMIFLVAEYVRKEHASNSREMLEKWLERSDNAGLGYGFSYSGIPRRLFYTVGACACVHNSSDFKDVMDLPKIDDGFARDYIHPRFIAVLLQLGDSLDLDNDRFHPLIKEVMGELPWKSEIHYEKHDSIRRLRISPLKITVAADCHSPEVLRLISRECDAIKNILKNASYHWSAICPDDLDARLPNFEPVELKLKGQIISDKLVNAEFKIQQKKAFNFLQGGNFYKDVKFAFLRELFQNAVDASKMQYWIDWVGGRWNHLSESESKKEGYKLNDMGGKLSPCAYPIVVEFHLAQREKNSRKITKLDMKSNVQGEAAKAEEIEHGVLVCMIDYGIGMSAEDIWAIADVGTSYEKNAERRKGMPSWLLPTAEFGIGLQSVFLVANSFVVYTHTRSGEKYDIVFQATGDKGNGYIHVMPSEENRPYGTKVEVFVPVTQKKKHQQELKTWCGKDPFSEDYDDERPFRHARELVVQLAIFLDEMIGERIFPIELKLYDFVEQKDQIYSQLLRKEIKRLNYKIFLDEKEARKDTEEKGTAKLAFEAREEYVAWPFRQKEDGDHIIRGQVGQVEYIFECKGVKLYLYDHEHHDVYARIGADRLQEMWEQTKKCVQEETGGTQIFYKGIYVEDKEWKKDANLLEYIDIKEKIERKYLKINRCEFTTEGQTYLEDQIYPQVLENVRMVLLHCDYINVIPTIKKRLEELAEDEQQEDQLYNAILAAAGLAVLAQIRNKNCWISKEEQRNAEEWNGLLKSISEIIDNGKEKKKSWADSSMFGIDVLKMKYENEQEDSNRSELVPYKENIAEILDSANKYAIMSVRRSEGRSWREFLIRLNPKDEPEEAQLICIMKKYIQLEKEREWKNRKGLLIKLEVEGDKLLDKCNKYAQIELKNNQMLGNSDRIIKWILCNVSSTEIFFSEDYNLRINVLGLEYSDELYLNRYIRRGIWEKIENIYRESNIERFATIVPCGYSGLKIYDKERSVYYVKRGFFLYMDRPYVINPLSGNSMKEVGEKLKEWSDFFWAEYKEFFEKIKNDEENKETAEGIENAEFDSNVVEIIEKYEDAGTFIKKQKQLFYKIVEEMDDEERNKEINREKEDQNAETDETSNGLYKKVLLYLHDKLTDQVAIKSLIEQLEEVFHIHDLKKIYVTYGLKDDKQDTNEGKVISRLLDYVVEKGGKKIAKEECRSLYKEYLHEWIYLMVWCI